MSAEASDVATVLYEKNGPTATITLNRPDARNTIVPRLMDELWAAVQDAAADRSLRVLVLRGAGRDFCAGADLKAYVGGQGPTWPETFGISAILHEAQIVTIAAGSATSAQATGFGWASACDLRICDDTRPFLQHRVPGRSACRATWLAPGSCRAYSATAKAREAHFPARQGVRQGAEAGAHRCLV